MSARGGYSQSFSGGGPYHSGYGSAQRSAYGGNPGLQYDHQGRSRGNYETRREQFTYANDPSSGVGSRGQQGHGGCRGRCSHHQHGGGYSSPRYSGDNEPAYNGGGGYGSEADQAPQLNMFRPDRGDQYAAYQRSRSGRSMQMRQDYPNPLQVYSNPQMPRGDGATSQESYSPLGPPPTSFGNSSGSGASGCGHAGCNHDHN